MVTSRPNTVANKIVLWGTKGESRPSSTNSLTPTPAGAPGGPRPFEWCKSGGPAALIRE